MRSFCCGSLRRERSVSEATTIDGADEVLNRQVPPALWDHAKGRPMSCAFSPSTKDQGMMSTLRARVAAREAHRRWTEDLKYESLGTWGVKVGDANALGLECLDDGQVDGLPADHASVDFTSLSRGARKVAGRKLRDLAGDPLFVPPST